MITENLAQLQAEQNGSARRCLAFDHDHSTDNAGSGVLKILEPRRGWAHLIGSALLDKQRCYPGGPVEYRSRRLKWVTTVAPEAPQ
jgi:hypothetical protein